MSAQRCSTRSKSLSGHCAAQRQNHRGAGEHPRVCPYAAAHEGGAGQISPEHMAHLARFPDFNSLEFDRALFEFDRVFEGEASQEDVYEEVMPAVRTVMNGSRLCIFAYGQTGSGKTHTMMGDYQAYFRAKRAGRMPAEGEDLRGVNVRALQSVFALAAVDSEEVRTMVRMSLVEVYNEKIVDLLGAEADLPRQS